jgi:hypothetical protein
MTRAFDDSTLNWVLWSTELTAAEECQVGDGRFGGIIFAECSDGICDTYSACQNEEFSISAGTRSRPRSDWSQCYLRHKNHPREKVAILMDMFKTNPTPTYQQRMQLAQRIHLSPEQVNTWFTNYRERSNKHTRHLISSI